MFQIITLKLCSMLFSELSVIIVLPLNGMTGKAEKYGTVLYCLGSPYSCESLGSHRPADFALPTRVNYRSLVHAG